RQMSNVISAIQTHSPRALRRERTAAVRDGGTSADARRPAIAALANATSTAWRYWPTLKLDIVGLASTANPTSTRTGHQATARAAGPRRRGSTKRQRGAAQAAQRPGIAAAASTKRLARRSHSHQ